MVQCMGRHRRGASHGSGSPFLGGGGTVRSQGRISGEGSLHWALKGPSDMEMQMRKERYFWKQKHLEQRQGDGKGALLCAEQRSRLGHSLGSPAMCPEQLKMCRPMRGTGSSFFLLFGEGWGPAKRQGIISLPKNIAVPCLDALIFLLSSLLSSLPPPIFLLSSPLLPFLQPVTKLLFPARPSTGH